MSKTILIDALYEDDQRLVVRTNNVIEEFSYQSGHDAFMKGNVYLARVTYVTPALQAVFVDYGGNKHGFLPFSEIHQGYYQQSDSEKSKTAKMAPKIPTNVLLDSGEEKEKDGVIDIVEEQNIEEKSKQNQKYGNSRDIVNSIKKDQLILVQVRKEERGNKGASLTTYISLVGRYWILAPMSQRNGGISKAVGGDAERERLVKILSDVKRENRYRACAIVRSAAIGRAKQEIRMDFQYLLKMWSNITKHAAKSSDITFVYAEADITRQAIRDFYTSDVNEIIISGKKAYKEACNFAKMVVPEALNKIKEYKGHVPIFANFSIEEQLHSLYGNVVNLPSGGHLVINETEALVAIDVNSGKDTVEDNVEGTALKNNLSAVKEIARQLKLRDLGGLIVIDFIDMSDEKNRVIVEEAMLTALSGDKAIYNVGEISKFGLLEMTRQRISCSLVESVSSICKNCAGRGRVRNTSITAAVVLRAIQNELATIDQNSDLLVSAGENVILYLLNVHKLSIVTLEERFKTKINLVTDEKAGFDGFFTEKIRKNVSHSEDNDLEVVEEKTTNAHAEWNKDLNRSTFLAYDIKKDFRSDANSGHNNRGSSNNNYGDNGYRKRKDGVIKNYHNKVGGNPKGESNKNEKKSIWKRLVEKFIG